jgi:type IV pilus assembly protein PilF
MSSFRKWCVALAVCSLLSACSSMPSSTPSKAEAKKIKTARINTQLGLTYLQRHQMEMAKEKLLLALKEAPNIPETWYSMAYYLEATGNPTEANQYYLKAVAIAPKNGETQNNYGTYLCRNAQYQASIQHFMSAVQDPEYLDTASAYENAGLCALKIPDHKLAVGYFNRALLQDPNLPTSLIELAHYDYGQQNYASAKEKLRQFLTISAPTDESRMLSAQLGQQSGYLATASNGQNKLLQLHSLDGDVQWS